MYYAAVGVRHGLERLGKLAAAASRGIHQADEQRWPCSRPRSTPARRAREQFGFCSGSGARRAPLRMVLPWAWIAFVMLLAGASSIRQ